MFTLYILYERAARRFSLSVRLIFLYECVNLRYVCSVNQWYKDSPWLIQSLCSGWSGRIQILLRSDLCIPICVYTRDSGLNPDSNTLDPDWLQHDHHTPYVVAQQYLSATFMSLYFHSHKEKLILFSKMLLLKFLFHFFFNCITLMLCDLKFHKSESVCTTTSCRMWTTKLDSKKCWKCFNPLAWI